MSMTPKQSLTRKQSLIRRSLAMLGAALLATAWAVGISTPASAAAPKALEIGPVKTSNTSQTCPDANRCAILVNQDFDVPVRVVDRNGDPATVSKDTTIVLEKVSSGKGSLEGDVSKIIPQNGSGTTFTVSYTESGNPTLRVRVTSGVSLNSDQINVPIALSAVHGDAAPNTTLDLDDPNCGAGSGVPTSSFPTCGHLITNGASGDVVMSVGSCEDAGSCKTSGGITALVVTVSANIQHSQGEHSTVILSCDKVLCGGTGVPKLPVIYTFDNNGDLTQTARACPRKNDIGNFEVCVDYVQSMRSNGDLYLVVLLAHDWRGSM
jgi:hypothetical protein